ncbi:hypothetical protein P7C71_g4384, partial [Lecanoromycetidae sp. Uapishka_2]
MKSAHSKDAKIYVVEHLDPELGPWSALEYHAIAQESAEAGVKFCLSSVSKDLELPPELRLGTSLTVEHQSVEELFRDDKARVCLLDPTAKAELRPQDEAEFDVFLFGGILEIRIDEHESSEMPFRYVKGATGSPVMPKGMIDLIKQDSEKGFGELL